MASANEGLRDEFIGFAVNLAGVSEGVKEKILRFLLILERELVTDIKESGIVEEGIPPSQILRRREVLLNQTRRTIEKNFQDASKELQRQLSSVAAAVPDSVARIFTDIFGETLGNLSMTATELKTIVSNSLIYGAPSADWWRAQTEELKLKFAQQVRLGMTRGESIDSIVKRVRGKMTGQYRVVELGDGRKVTVGIFGGGIMDAPYRNVASLVITSVATVSNQVLEEIYQVNQELLRGRQAVATLDSRTTDLCKSRDGGAWDFDGNPLPESRIKIPFPGPPPWHWRCRTVLIPITKSWDDLIAESGLSRPTRGKIADLGPSTRASMDGQVAASLNYDDWLRTKSERFQKRVLGEDKWKLWSSGKLDFKDLVDQRGNPIPISKLQERFG